MSLISVTEREYDSFKKDNNKNLVVDTKAHREDIYNKDGEKIACYFSHGHVCTIFKVDESYM